MAFNFPDTPSSGDLYTFGFLVWKYTSEGWVRVANAGQVVSTFISAGPFVDEEIAFPLPFGQGPPWTLLTYI